MREFPQEHEIHSTSGHILFEDLSSDDYVITLQENQNRYHISSNIYSYHDSIKTSIEALHDYDVMTVQAYQAFFDDQNHYTIIALETGGRTVFDIDTFKKAQAYASYFPIGVGILFFISSLLIGYAYTQKDKPHPSAHELMLHQLNKRFSSYEIQGEYIRIFYHQYTFLIYNKPYTPHLHWMIWPHQKLPKNTLQIRAKGHCHDTEFNYKFKLLQKKFDQEIVLYQKWLARQ